VKMHFYFVNSVSKMISWSAVVGLAFTCSTFGQSRPADFGNQWVKTHAFTLGGWNGSRDKFNYPQFQGAGLNTPTDGLPALPTHVFFAATDIGPTGYAGGDTGQALNEHITEYPNRAAWIAYDEPSRYQMDGVGRVVSQLKQVEANKLIYTNAFPSTSSDQLWGFDNPAPNPGYTYSQYLDDMMAVVQPDVLMYDYYPFYGDGSAFYNGYLDNMMTVRAKAQQYNVPYFGHVQANNIGGSHYLPTATELRAQLFSQLTAGYKGIFYWTYEAIHEPEALINENGLPSALYPIAAAANAEIARLGPTLVHLESTDVRYIAGSVSTPFGLQSWSSGAGFDPHILSIFSSNSANGLIGFFRDEDDQPYFMLTNLNNERDASEASMEGRFTLVFDSSIDEIYRLNRSTGQIDMISLTNHILINYTLLGGHGDLFNYSGVFAGVAVPEPSMGLLGTGGLLICGLIRRKH